jgi:hypothetical protein
MLFTWLVLNSVFVWVSNSIYMEHRFVDVKNVAYGPQNDDWASGGERFSHVPWDFVNVPARVRDARGLMVRGHKQNKKGNRLRSGWEKRKSG